MANRGGHSHIRAAELELAASEIIVRKPGLFYAQEARELPPPGEVEKVGFLDWGLERDHRIVYFLCSGQ